MKPSRPCLLKAYEAMAFKTSDGQARYVGLGLSGPNKSPGSTSTHSRKVYNMGCSRLGVCQISFAVHV